MTQLYIKQRLTASIWGVGSSGFFLLSESLSAMLLCEKKNIYIKYLKNYQHVHEWESTNQLCKKWTCHRKKPFLGEEARTLQ